MGDDGVDAPRNFGLLKEGLAKIGILDELLRDGIAHHSGVSSSVEELAHLANDLLRKSKENGFHCIAEPSCLANRGLLVKGR